jgi:hypothetical protein
VTEPAARTREDLSKLTDHELRWALRESIAVMFKHLGIEEEEEE